MEHFFVCENMSGTACYHCVITHLSNKIQQNTLKNAKCHLEASWSLFPVLVIRYFLYEMESEEARLMHLLLANLISIGEHNNRGVVRQPSVFMRHRPKNVRKSRTCVYSLSSPLRMLRAWCLSKDHPPRLEGTSSNPCIRAVLLSHWITPGQDSYS